MARAAAHLRMSQPSVSEAIANLEAALCVRLLDRNSRGIAPTIYAQALLKRGHVVFDELRQGIRDIEFLADPTTGEVRIGCPENISAGFVPAIIDRLSAKHPNISVHVANAETIALELKELHERTVDLLLGRLFKPHTDEDFDVQVLGEDEYFVVAGAQSPWARRRKIELAELTDERWVFSPPNNVPSEFYASAFHAEGLLPPRNTVTTFSLHVRIHLVATGRFLTIVPSSVTRFNAERWGLKILPVALKLPRVPVVIFTLKNRTLSPVVELFIEHAKAVAESTRRNITPPAIVARRGRRPRRPASAQARPPPQAAPA
jgi:DNA-binding transcriptional LysR family regulator